MRNLDKLQNMKTLNLTKDGTEEACLVLLGDHNIFHYLP